MSYSIAANHLASWMRKNQNDLRSKHELTWSNEQNKIIKQFLDTNGRNPPDTAYDDLLIQLNLGGYETVKNSKGQNIKVIILAKVKKELSQIEARR